MEQHISPAKTVWVNGRIRTMDEGTPLASCMAADPQGRLLAVGGREAVEPFVGPATRVVDLGGAAVVPGFIEGHAHLEGYGQTLRTLAIRDISKEEILEKVRAAARAAAPGSWIIGGMGWNNEVWDDPSYPTKEELDAAAPDNPVMLPRMDGHLIWVNSRAFAVCGITRDTPNPAGGEFMRTADGALLGCVGNAAADIIKSHIPDTTREERIAQLLAAQEKLLSYGITSVTDMGTTLEMIDALEELYRRGDYKLRFYGALRGFVDDDATDAQRAYLASCPKIGLYGDRFTIRCCKLLGDGSVGAQSAHLLEDFSDRPGHRGTGMYTDEEMTRAVRRAAERGMQVAVHSIGDATIEQVLRVYARVLAERPCPDHRWRIEHFQTVTSDTPQRAAALGAVASMQPMHAPNSAGMALRRLGEKRVRGAYAAGLVLRSTGMVAFGSDCPVATPSPLSGMHAAITRTNDQLEPKGGFCPENAVTPLEALHGYTDWGAYAMFAEDSRGSLAPGKWADFAVLDADPVELGEQRPDDLLKTRVLATVIAGGCVFCSL